MMNTLFKVLSHFYLLLGSNEPFEKIQHLDYTGFKTGFPHIFANQVISTSNVGKEQIDQVFNFYGKTPFFWQIPNDSTALQTSLRERGLIYAFTARGMHLKLNNIANSSVENVTISKVTSLTTLQEWVTILAQTFHFPQNFSEELIAPIFENRGNSFHFYIAHQGDKPVGIAMSLLNNTQVSLYNVGVLKEAGRQGIGGMLTMHALIEAKELGARDGYLEASDDIGYNLYSKLGFSEVGKYQIFVKE